MKKCPNCGRILHDDSIFCFGCMSEINKRQEIVLATPKKVFLKAKITTPIIAVALVSATVFGVYTYNNNSDKTTAVKKMHTSIYCHCHHKYTCDNYSASRHHCHDYYHKKGVSLTRLPLRQILQKGRH